MAVKPEERYGVYLAHDKKCFWCAQPLDYISMTLDHVIPQAASERLQEIIAFFGLPVQFSIESYENWVPAHGLCNTLKSDKIFENAPATQFALERVRLKAASAREHASRINSQAVAADALTKFEIALTKGAIGIAQAMELIHRLETDEFGWRVLEERDGVQKVRDGNVVATRPSPGNDDASWICGNCRFRGPWQGAICTVCGVRSMPD